MVRQPTHSVFPELASPDAVYRDRYALDNHNHQIEDFNKYTGISDRIGKSTCHNSPLAAMQFTFTLRAAGKQYLERILKAQDRKAEADKLVQEKVLAGASIIDVGCGAVPTYARCARALGAEVYTVDVLPASAFDTWGLSPEEEKAVRELDSRYHVQQDLNDFSPIRKILEKTNGQVHLVTQAHLFSGYDFKLGRRTVENMLLDLLMPNGCYFGVNGGDDDVRIKEQPEKNYADW
jgi:hypothetical protein